MSVAEAALARDKPLTALLLRYRPLLVKTVPERHVTLVVLKLVLSKAKKTVTGLASVPPNAVVDVRADKNAKMVAALQVVLCRSAKIK